MSGVVPAGALEAWRALSDALAGLSEPTPCQQDPELWFEPRAVDSARYGCARCPVAAECGAYAVAADERFGVWAGVDEKERRSVRLGVAS